MEEEEEGGLTAWTYPLEIISVIMTFLVQRGGTGKDIISCMSVCSSWRTACQQGQVWEMMFKRKWRKQYPTTRKHIQHHHHGELESSHQPNFQELQVLRKIKGNKLNPARFALLPSVRKEEGAWMKACKDRLLPNLLFVPGVKQISQIKFFPGAVIPRFSISESGDLIALGLANTTRQMSMISIVKSPVRDSSFHSGTHQLKAEYSIDIPNQGRCLYPYGPMTWLPGDNRIIYCPTPHGNPYWYPESFQAHLVDVETRQVTVVVPPSAQFSIMAMQADRDKIVVGGNHGIRLYDIRQSTSSPPVWKYNDGGGVWVRTLRYNQKLLIIGCEDGTVNRFDWRMLKKKDLEPTIGVLSKAVQNLAIEDSLLVALDANRNTATFDLSTNTQLATTVPPLAEVSSPPTWNGYGPPMLYLNRQRECILFSFLDGVRAVFSCLKPSDLSLRGKPFNLIPHCHGIRGQWEIREDFMFSAWEGGVFAFAQLDWLALDKGGDQP